MYKIIKVTLWLFLSIFCFLKIMYTDLNNVLFRSYPSMFAYWVIVHFIIYLLCYLTEYTIETISTPSKTLQYYTLSGLDPYTTYSVKVRGATIEGGVHLWGEFSHVVNITTSTIRKLQENFPFLTLLHYICCWIYMKRNASKRSLIAFIFCVYLRGLMEKWEKREGLWNWNRDHCLWPFFENKK